MTEYTGRVSVNVIQYEDRYLLAKRSKDGLWEFIGGKEEKTDTGIKQTAVREAEEEFGIEPKPVKVGESYQSKRDSRYRLVPVYMEAESLEVEMKDEHLAYEWISLEEFENYDTKGQKQALENLDLV